LPFILAASVAAEIYKAFLRRGTRSTPAASATSGTAAIA
jgi:hypothetical protein